MLEILLVRDYSYESAVDEKNVFSSTKCNNHRYWVHHGLNSHHFTSTTFSPPLLCGRFGYP